MAIIKSVKIEKDGDDIILYHVVSKVGKRILIILIIMLAIIICHVNLSPASLDLLYLMEIFSLLASPYLFWHFFKIWNFRLLINNQDQVMIFDYKVFKRKIQLEAVNSFLIKKKELIDRKDEHSYAYKLFYNSAEGEKFMLDVLNVRNTKSNIKTRDKEVVKKLNEFKHQFHKFFLKDTGLNIDIAIT